MHLVDLHERLTERLPDHGTIRDFLLQCMWRRARGPRIAAPSVGYWVDVDTAGIACGVVPWLGVSEPFAQGSGRLVTITFVPD